MNAGHVASEEDHIYDLVVATQKIVPMEQPSPASKRNIAAMNSSFKRPLPRNVELTALSTKPSAGENEDDEEEFVIPRSNLMNRYLESSDANMEIVERNAPVDKEPDKARERKSAKDRSVGRPNNSRLLQTTFDSDLTVNEYETLNFFNGKTFAIQNVDNVQDYTQVAYDVQNFGGTVVEKNFKGEVDVLVTSPVLMTDFKPLYKAKEVVTMWWLEDVIAARAEVPVQYYHRIITLSDETVLKGITCTISTYSGMERQYLTVICQAMGATLEDKYEKRKFPILICQKPEGSKYKGAVNWGFPVVAKEWLLDSYKKTYLHKLEDYLVGESKLINPLFIELNQRGIHKGADPPSGHNDSSVIHIRCESPQLSQVPPTPRVPSAKRKSDDADTFVRGIEKRQRIIDNLELLPNCSPSMNNRVKALRSESKSSSSPTTPTSQHVREMGQEFGYDTPRRKQLYEVLKETSNLTPQTPQTPQIMKMPSIKLHPDPEATPGRQWAVLNKFSGFAKNDGKEEKTKEKKKVEPQPTTPLSEIKRRFWQQTLGEEYAYNNNSTMLNINSQQLDVVTNHHQDQTTVDLDAANEEEAVASTSKADENNTSSTDQTVPGENSTTLKALTDFISKRKSEPRKVVANLETCPVDCTETQTNNPDIMVGWAEPSEMRSANTSQSGSSKSSGGRQSTARPTPNIITTGLEVTQQFVTMVEELRGELQTKAGPFDSNFTHVICAKPARVEKVMCAIAAGKWVLPLKYVENSWEAKEFLDEELYEWANPKCDANIDALSSMEKMLVNAAYSWRTRIQSKTSDEYREGAFQGFKVLLWVKNPGFRNIIEAGGGKVLDVG